MSDDEQLSSLQPTNPVLLAYTDNLNSAAEQFDKNYTICNHGLLCSEATSSPCMLGIDEAGRGPVLGPMVYASAICPIKRTDELKDTGLTDSKMLTEAQRESLLDTMLTKSCDWLAPSIRVISPVFITNKMLGKNKTSLNVVSQDAAISLIQEALDNNINLKKVYVDTVGKAEIYQAKLKSLFPQLDICVESKADLTYAIVSAASVFAKVTRDRLLRLCPSRFRGNVESNLEIGSGYPGDPLTKAYLTKCIDPVFGFPSLVRSSWSTADVLMQQHGISCLWEDEVPDPSEKPSRGRKRPSSTTAHSKQLSSYFEPQAPSDKKRRLTRAAFFRQAGLVHVDKF